MSVTHSPREYIAPYETLSEWEEALLGDEELFREMAAPHMPALLKAARKAIDAERREGNLPPDLLQPEELVGETLILAWEARHGRSERRPLKDWLLEMQRHALHKLIEEEKKLHGAIVVSLEAYAPSGPDDAAEDENEFWRWGEPSVHELWADIIPDEQGQAIAA